MPMLPPLKPWKYYLPGSFTGLLFPRNVQCLSGEKELCILRSRLALHIKSEVTALPSQEHTVDSWALQTCVRIKAKLFMMDDITDNDTVMGWKYGQNMQMGGVTQMVSPMEQSEAALV